MHLYLFYPVLNIYKTLPVVDGVGEHDAHGSTVVSLSDRFEFLLASSVPYLQPHLLLADHYRLYFEINADCSEMGCHEIVLAKFQKHVRLTHSTVTDHQQLY